MDNQDPPDPNPTRSHRRRRRPAPAFVSGTSTEFLGRKPLPRAVQDRPLVFLLGPRGVGKSRVASRLLPDARHLDERETREHIQHHLLRQAWQDGVLDAPTLIIESPCFLSLRPPFCASLQTLLQARVRARRRTVVVEAVDGMSVQTNLLQAVPPMNRATVVLRFPVGRGRQRFVARVCDELGIPRSHARAVRDLEPWTYEAIYRHLQAAAAAPSTD